MCKVGKLGMYYEATSRKLCVPDLNASIVRIKHPLSHRIRVEVKQVVA